jgi:hypothetical protein
MAEIPIPQRVIAEAVHIKAARQPAEQGGEGTCDLAERFGTRGCRQMPPPSSTSGTTRDGSVFEHCQLGRKRVKYRPVGNPTDVPVRDR